MKLRCLTGHIGYGGVIHATGDVFDIDNDAVVKSLMVDGDAEEIIDEVQVPDVKPDTNEDVKSVDTASTEVPTSTKNTRKKVVSKR